MMMIVINESHIWKPSVLSPLLEWLIVLFYRNHMRISDIFNIASIGPNRESSIPPNPPWA